MANICDFEMHIRGTEENCKQFINALEQNGKYWMGRGAEIDIFDEDVDDDGTKTVGITGWCKWSLWSALFENAMQMKTRPEMWDIGSKVLSKEIIPITYEDACDRWQIEMEAWSDECGCCFSEHIVYNHDVKCIKTYDYEEKEDEETGEWYVVTKPEGFYEFDF